MSEDQIWKIDLTRPGQIPVQKAKSNKREALKWIDIGSLIKLIPNKLSQGPRRLMPAFTSQSHLLVFGSHQTTLSNPRQVDELIKVCSSLEYVSSEQIVFAQVSSASRHGGLKLQAPRHNEASNKSKALSPRIPRSRKLHLVQIRC